MKFKYIIATLISIAALTLFFSTESYSSQLKWGKDKQGRLYYRYCYPSGCTAWKLYSPNSSEMKKNTSPVKKGENSSSNMSIDVNGIWKSGKWNGPAHTIQINQTGKNAVATSIRPGVNIGSIFWKFNVLTGKGEAQQFRLPRVVNGPYNGPYIGWYPCTVQFHSATNITIAGIPYRKIEDNISKEKTGSSTVKLSSIEKDLINEINLLRSNPKAYSEKLRKYKNADEAIGVLKATKNLPAFKPSQGLCRAAKDHVNDLGPKGSKGHTGSDGSTFSQRADRYGSGGSSGAENISYGKETAEEMVIQWLIDENIPDRIHRKILLDPSYRYIGVGCGYHNKWKIFSVMDVAVNYREN